MDLRYSDLWPSPEAAIQYREPTYLATRAAWRSLPHGVNLASPSWGKNVRTVHAQRIPTASLYPRAIHYRGGPGVQEAPGPRPSAFAEWYRNTVGKLAPFLPGGQ